MVFGESQLVVLYHAYQFYTNIRGVIKKFVDSDAVKSILTKYDAYRFCSGYKTTNVLSVVNI